MPISFACPKCGKSLKAPDSAAGKSSTCPGCNSRVTCPEPVLDAELVEVGPAGPDVYGDLGGDSPYGMAAGAPAAAASAPSDDARRPCPMCGEMIVVGAAKCRFCGEVFDPVVKKAGKSGKGGKKARLKAMASHQRNLMICILIQVISYIILVVLRASFKGAPDPATSLFILCLAGVLIAGGIGGSIYAFLLASRIYNTGIGILLAFLSLLGCLGLIVLFMINKRATEELRAHGYEIGFLGART